jgi:D-xylose ABC transporter substrate-binding protein
MKKLLLLFSVLLLSIPYGCDKETVKVGFLLSDLETERWQKDMDLFQSNVEAQNGEVITRIANSNAELQLKQAIELIKDGVDVLVVVPADLNLAAQIVNRAHENDVKVISYDRLIKNCNLDFYISFDNVEVGKLQAEYLTTVCPKGEYALVGGPTTDNNSFLLRLGQLSVLQPYMEKGDISVVYDQYVESWTKEEGYKHTKVILDKHPEVSAIILANDLLAKGAAEAIEEAGIKRKIYTGGQDANLDACQRIVSGEQTMTIYKPIEAIANTAANIAVKMAENKDVGNTNLSVNNGKKMVPSMLLHSMVVNKGTIELTVVADGYLKEHNIYK